MQLADGVLLVVDVLEGVGAATERAIQQAVAEGLVITLLVSKVSSMCYVTTQRPRIRMLQPGKHTQSNAHRQSHGD